jgi:sugar-specific transcriptional regulator TrmB
MVFGLQFTVMKVEELQKLGLNKSEAKIYLTLLEIGSSSAGIIAEKAQVSPSKIYWVLEKLMQKGLVSYIIKAKTKFYCAASPQKLRDYLEEEKEKVEEREEFLEEMIPKLVKLAKLAEDKQEAEMFVGFPAMKNAYFTMYDSAKKGDEHLVFLRSSKEEEKPSAVLFFNKLHRSAVEIGLKRKLLARDTLDARDLFKKGAYAKRKGDEVRFIDIAPQGINILNDYVLLMHLADKPICVLIRSSQLSDDYQRLFFDMWKKARK